MKFEVLYNKKTKRYEMYKCYEIKKLRNKLAKENGQEVIDGTEANIEINNGQAVDDEEEGDEKEGIKRSVQNLNLEECVFIEWISNKEQLQEFEMVKVLQDEDAVNSIKRMPRKKADLDIVRPWQNRIMAKFLENILTEEREKGYMLKSTVLRRFNEYWVPITWARIASFQVYYEKKTCYPPWSPSKKITIMLPLLDKDNQVKIVESSITQIIQDKIDKDLEKFKLPIRLADIQKEYQMRLKITEPPLFVVVKQLEVDMDQFFYKVLEQRGNISQAVLKHLRENHSESEWAQEIVRNIADDELHLFMPFSHQSLIARESIERELDRLIGINTICEQGQLYGYMATKYLNIIKSNDEFDKILMECYIKHGYRLVKIGSGNYIMNSTKYRPDSLPENQDPNMKLFNYNAQKCCICLEEIPDYAVLEEMLEQYFRVNGELESLTYHENQQILVVNNYASLTMSLRTMKKQKSLGVDLEGRLKIGGNINLIQIACEEIIYIFDMYQIQKLSQDEGLLQLTIQVLKCVFLDSGIRKVFFDGKKDVEALHFILGVGCNNYYDTQALHMVLTQLKEMQKNKKLFEIKHSPTPGLNDVLGKHEVAHGLNSLKNKFKAIFDDYQQCKVYFTTRPIDPDFVSYSAQDVQDLSELADLINAKIDSCLEKGLNPEYRSILVDHLSDTYCNKSCQKKIQYEIESVINQDNQLSSQ
eukprot:403360645